MLVTLTIDDRVPEEVVVEGGGPPGGRGLITGDRELDEAGVWVGDSAAWLVSAVGLSAPGRG